MSLLTCYFADGFFQGVDFLSQPVYIGFCGYIILLEKRFNHCVKAGIAFFLCHGPLLAFI
jgi:hypothetical protein